MMAGPASVKVLLIEDSEDDALIVRRAFKVLKLPHELLVMTNGDAAAQALEAGSVRPDLILMDVNLPGVSGIELLRRVKSNPDLRRIPMVILSASDRETDLRDAYDAGANTYLVKPIRFEDFLPMMRAWSDYWTTWGRLAPP